MFKRLFLTWVVSLVLCGGSWAGTFEDGAAAFQRGEYSSALKLLRQSAVQGHARAQGYLGVMYDNGQGVVQNQREAVKWYTLAASQGDAEAQYNLGTMYYAGLGVARNYAEAARWFRLAALQGDARSEQWMLSALEQAQWDVREGAAVEPRIAADDDPEIMVFPADDMDMSNKSTAYRAGIKAFNRRDCKTTLRLFLPLAESGDVDAQVNIGLMYLKGWHVKQDDGEAIKWFLPAAEQGFATAQQNMAFMYMEGFGVERNHAEAAKWYRLAAEQSDMMSQYNMGVLSRDGTGVERNLSEAVTWFSKSAKQSHVGAVFNLGVMYRDGRGVGQDYAKAAELFEAVAEIGFAPAQFDLALAYLNGLGVEQDYQAAETWFGAAARQGDAKAQYNLGVMYLNGVGVEGNRDLAARWIKKAAANGHPAAQEAAEQLAAGVTLTTPAQAREHKANVTRCLVAPVGPVIRISACTSLLDSGNLAAEGTLMAYYNRSISYRQLGRYDQAIADLNQVTRLDPEFADAYNALAWVLATAKDARYRDGEQALDLARKAISRNDEVNFHDTLAAAYAETGRFADAAAEQDRAIAMLRAAGMTDAVADFQSRRDLYRQRRPYRD